MTKRNPLFLHLMLTLFLLLPGAAFASAGSPGQLLDLTGHWVGITALMIFVLAYVVVILEEFLHLRKS
ncbi:MAG: sodium:proton antiporter, partial [Gammaproteobacteria bacterium]